MAVIAWRQTVFFFRRCREKKTTKKKKQQTTTYSIPNGLQGIEQAKMCQDGEVSITRFSGDLCSSWKPCESMTARQIKPPCPGLLRHLNWHRLGWLRPNDQFYFSSSMTSSWTVGLQTIDTLHIFQQQTCYWSLWLWTLLCFSPCWCGWTAPQCGINTLPEPEKKVSKALCVHLRHKQHNFNF